MRLTALRDGARSAVLNAGARAKPNLDRMQQAMRVAAPNTGAVAAYFSAARESIEGARWAMFSAALQARAVLTDAQRRMERADRFDTGLHRVVYRSPVLSSIPVPASGCHLTGVFVGCNQESCCASLEHGCMKNMRDPSVQPVNEEPTFRLIQSLTTLATCRPCEGAATPDAPFRSSEVRGVL